MPDANAIVAQSANSPSRQISAVASDHEGVIESGRDELYCFPDEPISFLNEKPPSFLMVADVDTVCMHGASLRGAHKDRTVLTPSRDGDFDNDYAGISSVYYDDSSRRHFGFYHAENRVGMPRLPENPKVFGAYWSIGLAVSEDKGQTFRKLGQILSSSVSRQQALVRTPMREHQGIGEVSVTPNAAKDFLFAFYTDLTPDVPHIRP